MAPAGKLIVLVGLILVVIGILLWLSPKIPWLGKLPGDFHYEGKGVKIYFPLATCLILSIVISVVLFLMGKK
jgi:thiosulfate reductase cytochrome b subunit